MDEPTLSLPPFPPRRADSHKGDFGRALLVGASRGMSGAIALAGMATLRSGAGLVKLAVPDPCVPTVASFEPSYMTYPLQADSDGRLGVNAYDGLAPLLERATVLAIGPGLGRSMFLNALVVRLFETVGAPMVIDADALNALAERRTELPVAAGPRVLTPHPGEFARLVGKDRVSQDERRAKAERLAREWNAVVVLKGQHTLITDGQQTTYNQTGNPGMATGGTGDVLTGIITGLICQGFGPFEAAQLAVHLHGAAGDLAAKQLGEVGMIASDLLKFLPEAIKQYQAENASS